jgi:hypothetical protein
VTTYILDEDEHGKKTWVEKPKRQAKKSAAVHLFGDNYISPVDGTNISSHKVLVEHNRRNNVTNDLESLREQGARELARAGNIQPEGTRRERLALIRDEFERHQSSGNNRDLGR